MQSLLNALSALDKEDGVGVQIMLRPAGSAWRKEATAISGKKRKGTKDKKGAEKAFGGLTQVLTAFTKPPEEKLRARPKNGAASYTFATH